MKVMKSRQLGLQGALWSKRLARAWITEYDRLKEKEALQVEKALGIRPEDRLSAKEFFSGKPLK